MHANRQGGVTLLELLLVIVLMAVVTAISVPSLTRLIDTQTAWSARHELHAALQHARFHAVNRRVPTVICRSGDGQDCNQQGHWGEGWILFEDATGSNDCQVDPDTTTCHHGGRVVQVHQGGRPSVVVVHNSNVANRIRFNTLGASPGYTGRFTVCNHEGEALRGLVVSQSGRVRTASAGDFLDCPVIAGSD